MNIKPAVCAFVWASAASVAAAQTVRAADPAAAAAIRKADEAFCQAVTDRRVDRFRSFIAEDATFNGGAPAQLRGVDAIASAWTPYFQPGGPTLTWKPVEAVVLASGDLGYTVGTYERRTTGADGKPSISRGNYLTIWKKQPDGSWKAIFDTGGVIAGT